MSPHDPIALGDLTYPADPGSRGHSRAWMFDELNYLQRNPGTAHPRPLVKVTMYLEPNATSFGFPGTRSRLTDSETAR